MRKNTNEDSFLKAHSVVLDRDIISPRAKKCET